MAAPNDSLFDSNALPSLSEAMKAFGDIGPAEWMMLLGALLWLLILQVSLALIDRRDHQAGMTYMLFMLAAGVMLVIALPSRLRMTDDFTRGQLWACVALLIISGLRWYLRAPQVARVIVKAKPKAPAADTGPTLIEEPKSE